MKIIIFTFLLICAQSYSQWQPDVRLTNDPAGSGTSGYTNARCIATNGDTVNIVWRDNRSGGNYEIYYKRSTDSGITWGSDTRISNNIYMSSDPTISVSGSVVHIAWDDNRDGNYEIYYNRSTDGGSSWGTDMRLTNDPAASQVPSISVSGSNVHVAWEDNRNAPYIRIYYKRSTDGGLSWSADTQLMNNTSSSWYPTISASGYGVKIVWTDNRNGHQDIYFKASTDGGLNWATEIPLVNDTVIKNNPTLSVSGSVVFVTWMDSRDRYPNYEIYYKRSIDGGLTWGANTRLTTNHTSATLFSNISVSGSGVHVIWDDNRDGNYEIYYKRSTDGGNIWGADTRLTNNSSASAYPFISASGSVVHVMWQDIRDGNYEIYYKRDPTGNPVTAFQSQFYRNNLNKAITDNLNTLDTITLDYSLMPSNYYVYDVNLNIDSVIHTNDGDLEYYLIHNGITDTAIYQVGGSGDNFISTVLNDSAVNTIAGGTAPFTGSFKPQKLLSQFNGQGINGAWILKIYDRATGNTGTLKAWSLNFLIGSIPIGVSPVNTEIPKSFSLSQNYPNPFNPVTNIKFQLPKAAFVKLVIFDMLGRELETLINENLNAGTYKADWNAASYSSGVYFYKIQTGEFSEIKKMILVK